MRGARLSVLLLMASAGLPACGFTRGALALGVRHERGVRFESAYREENRLIIFYEARQTTDDSPLAPSVAPDQPRWSALDLSTVGWTPVRPDITTGVRLIMLDIQTGQRPQPRVQAETMTIAPFDDCGDSGMELPTSQPPGTLALQDTSRQSLILLSRPIDETAPLEAAVLQVRPREYTAWWAIPARIGLVPFALVADAVATPPAWLVAATADGLDRLGLVSSH